MEMGNSSPSVAQLNDCVLCPEIQKTVFQVIGLARPLSRYFAGAGCIVLRWHDSREVLQPLSLPRHPKNEASRNA